MNPAYPGGSSSANAIGYNATNETFYFFENGGSSATQKFVSFTPATNTYTVLANSPITAGVNRGCVSFNGMAYYCLDGNGNLCYYDIPTNTWTLIGSVYTDQFNNNTSSNFSSLTSGDMAIDGLGNMWIVASSSAHWGLFRINAPLPTSVTANISVTQLIAPTTTTPGGIVFAGIAFNTTGQIYMSTPNDLYLLQNNYTLSHLGTFSVAGSGADLTSCSYPIGVLPVSWTGFSAVLENNGSVLLNWSVDQQVNNQGYAVERSRDGSNWENIASLDNQPSEGQVSYQATDANPAAGINYYRIRQKDLDGQSSFSTIQSIEIAGRAKSVQIWPNPARTHIQIQTQALAYGENIRAQIFSQSGQPVSVTQLQGSSSTIDISSLPVGNYVVHVSLPNGETVNQKLVKL